MATHKKRPFRLYVYNDLEEYVNLHAKKEYYPLLNNLINLLLVAIAENKHIRFLTQETQVKKLKIRKRKPYGLTLATGENGREIAQALNTMTGVFPTIKVLPMSRNEVDDNSYMFSKLTHKRLDKMLKDLHGTSIAIIDDTIYSGFTIQTILDKLDPRLLAHTDIYCMQAIGSTFRALSKRVHVQAGSVLHGEINTEVSVIRASGLFETGAIKRYKKKSLAFFERRVWMQQWFPKNSALITRICRDINLLLSTKQKNVTFPSSRQRPSLFTIIER